MDERSKKRLPWMIGAVVVLLLLMFLVPMFKPSAHPGEPSQSSPSITTGATADSAFSPATVPATNEEGGGFSFGGGEVFSLLWRLALVLMVLGICVAGLRWWSKRTSGPRSSTGYLRIIDTLPFQGGRSVHLVAVGERVIVVGATAQQLSFLAELKDEDAATLLEDRAEAVEPSVSAFAAQLFQSLRREGSRPTSGQANIIGEFE